MRIAFSTSVCPDLTLSQVAALAQRLEFDGVELLTEGPRASTLACDPFLSDDEKTREMFREAGCPVMSLGTSVRFDEPISVPVIGFALSNNEQGVRECKRAVATAAQLDCGLVRAHAFQIPAGEGKRAATSRIADRIRLAVDDARGTGVRVCVQNGGSFCSGQELADLLDLVDRPAVAACYAPHLADGEHPGDAMDALGSKLAMIRISDHEAGTPVSLGEGEAPCEEAVHAASARGFDGVAVYEWDCVWNEKRDDLEHVLIEACERMHKWAVTARHPEMSGA